jgi:hypothetical protein
MSTNGKKRYRFPAEVINAQELSEFLRKSNDPVRLLEETGQIALAPFGLDLLMLYGQQVLRVKTGSIAAIEATETKGSSGELQATIDRLSELVASCEDTSYAEEYKKLVGWLQELRLRRLGECPKCREVKLHCTDCGDVIPDGHGIHNGRTFKPVCTSCQARRMMSGAA